MSRANIFPYPFSAEGLTLSTEPGGDSGLDLAGRTIRAYELPDDGRITVPIEVRISEGVLDDVLPPAELAAPPVSVNVAVRSIESRLRRSIELTEEDGVWKGSLDEPKSALFGTLTLEPMLVRSAPGSDEGFALHEGAVIAGGEAVTLEVDERPPKDGGLLEIKFEDFRDSPNDERRRNPDLVYWLNTEAETPVLFINEGVEDLKRVMWAKGPRGYDIRIRDAVIDTIVSQVWTAIAGQAFASLALGIVLLREAEDDSDPMEQLSDLHQRVIRFWAPEMFGKSVDESVTELVATAANPRLFPELYDMIGRAVQKLTGTERAFRGLLRMRDGEGV